MEKMLRNLASICGLKIKWILHFVKCLQLLLGSSVMFSQSRGRGTACDSEPRCAPCVSTRNDFGAEYPWSGGQHHRIMEHDLHRLGACAAIAGGLPPVGDEDVARLSPFIHEQHINQLGRYSFAVPEAVTRGELLALCNSTMQMLNRGLRSITP